MPEALSTASGQVPLSGQVTRSDQASVSGRGLSALRKGQRDTIGAVVTDVLFRGQDYAIYRSNRGVYVHFADDPVIEHAQRSAYVKLSVQICELRYLTSQMRSGELTRFVSRRRNRDLLYDHNMAQALMLLMESVTQRADHQDNEADRTEQQANDIAKRALDMAVSRNTVDNTIRYVRTCVLFGLGWLLAVLALYQSFAPALQGQFYLLASATGIIGAVFSVIVRAEAFELKPCDDSGMNKLMSLIRVGMGGIAGPALFLLLMTVAANALPGAMNAGGGPAPDLAGFRMVAIIGLLGGFAERLVPDLARGAADKMESRAGTPGQAVQAATARSPDVALASEPARFNLKRPGSRADAPKAGEPGADQRQAAA